MQVPTQDPDWLTQAAHNASNGDGNGAGELPSAPQTNGPQSQHEAGTSEAARGAAAAARPLPSDDFDDEVGTPFLQGSHSALSVLAKFATNLLRHHTTADGSKAKDRRCEDRPLMGDGDRPLMGGKRAK